MKNRIIIAITAMLMALAFILPAQAAGNTRHPGGSVSGHAHGPHTNPQGKTVGKGDPYFNQSWWYQYNANQTQVQDWGGLTTSGDWPASSVQWVGTLTLVDTTTNNPSWQQSQTTYDNTGPDLTSPWAALNAGDTYKLEWHMVGTLLQPGWTWGTMSTGACVGTGTATVTCDYTVNQILIPLMATPTVQPTPVPPSCNFSGETFQPVGNDLVWLSGTVYEGPNGIGSITGQLFVTNPNDGSIVGIYDAGTYGNGRNSQTWTVEVQPPYSGFWNANFSGHVVDSVTGIECGISGQWFDFFAV